METKGTKQRILDEALSLFSVYGFRGVTVKEIAKAVGIKDSSLYKHFRSKQEIYNTLLKEMDARFEETVLLYGLPQGELSALVPEYGRSDLVMLKEACKAVFLFFIKDQKAVRFRKMLMIEQYNNNDAAITFRNWFMDTAIEFQKKLFKEMIGQGYVVDGSADIIALQFYAPFYVLLCQYDSMSGREDEAVSLLMQHIEQFAKVYFIKRD